VLVTAMTSVDRMFRVIVTGGIALAGTTAGVMAGCGGGVSSTSDAGGSGLPDGFPSETAQPVDAHFVQDSADESTPQKDAAGDALLVGDASGDGPVHTATHDCAPACGTGRFCEYPLGPGICPGSADAGFCPQGCPGCPALPPPACNALPAACGGKPSCDCLLKECPGGCGGAPGSCTIDADGDWVISCTTC